MRYGRVRMPSGMFLVVSVGAHPGVPKASHGAVRPYVVRVVVVVSNGREGGGREENKMK